MQAFEDSVAFCFHRSIFGTGNRRRSERSAKEGASSDVGGHYYATERQFGSVDNSDKFNRPESTKIFNKFHTSLELWLFNQVE